MSSHDILYYDGKCGLCQRSVRWLKRLDWFACLRFADMHDVDPDELPVTLEMAELGIPMQTKKGGVLVGYPAVRRALRQTILGLVPAMVMYVPGISHIGVRVYAWIARNRRSVCELPVDRSSV